MIGCISVENMRRSDAYTIAKLVPSRELMHRAARGVYLAADWQGNTAIVVGSGNNGGDGFALACILHEHGHACCVFTVSERLSEDSAYYAQMAASIGVLILPFTSGCLKEHDTVVDCLLGTGFCGSVRPDYRAAMEEINAFRGFTVSVDINSGMNGDTGEAEYAVHSDLTVTIGYVKKGLVSRCAGRYIKKLICADIGIVLLREEEKISAVDEATETHCIPCPPWLDMQVLRAYE